MNKSLTLLQESTIKIKNSQNKTNDDNLYIGQLNNQSVYVLLVPKSSEQNLHFTFEFNKLNEIKMHRNLRQYQELISEVEYNKYIFLYQEGKTIAEQIEIMKSNKMSFTLEIIKTYTFKLMQALYQLHKMELMGRCFNTQNILEYKENQNIQIILMNFGFFSDLNHQEFSLLPPEIYLQKIYDLKLDVWLLGAFMYNLVKLNPISTSKSYESIIKQSANRQANDVQSYIETKSQSGRYSNDFTFLIENMLTYDKENRISFKQLLNHQFWQGLENLNEMQTYYDQNENQLNETLKLKIQRREVNYLDQTNGELINTNNLLAPEHINESTPTLQIPHEVITNQAQNSQCEDYSSLFIYQYHNYELSPYFKFWEQIYLDQYAFLLLQETSKNIEERLQQTGIHELALYILQKMEFLLIKDLLSKLRQDKNPWSNQSNADWNKFRQTPEKIMLEEKLILQARKIQARLTEVFPKIVKFQSDEKIDPLLQQSLQRDKDNKFEFIDEKSDFFLRHGYRQFTLRAFLLITTQSNIANAENKARLLPLTLQIILCHIINRAFQKENFESMYPIVVDYKRFKQNNQHSKIEIIPADIFKFIKYSTSQETYKQINHIIDSQFQH